MLYCVTGENMWTIKGVAREVMYTDSYEDARMIRCNMSKRGFIFNTIKRLTSKNTPSLRFKRIHLVKLSASA